MKNITGDVCACGRKHVVEVDKVVIESDALRQVPGILKEFHYQKPYIVSDVNTFEAAGKDLLAYLDQENISYKSFVFEDKTLVPDENALGKVLLNYDPSCDVIIAVGSGTLNDLCKYFSFKIKMQYFIVASAPSMDGFASTGAALITSNLKTTYTTHCPQVIIGDLKVLANAPREMIAAGVADILGKYTCLCDWKIAHLINDEYYCPEIVAMVEQSLQAVIDNIDGIVNKEEQAVKNVMKALVDTGIAMSFAGYSRPASGCEHHLSHFWEMKFLFEGKEAVLHGVKVGIATVIALDLYKRLAKESVDVAYAKEVVSKFSQTAWEANIRRTLLDASEEVIRLEAKVKKNDLAAHARRIESIKEVWPQIVEVIATLPESHVVSDMLKRLGGVTKPAEIGIEKESVYDAVIVAKEVRDRYTLLQLLWDLGFIETYAGYASEA